MRAGKFVKLCGAIVLSWVIVMTSVTAVFAEDFSWLRVDDTIESVQDVMGREAEAQLFASILISCVAGGIDVDDYLTSHDGSRVFPKYNDLKSPSKIFDRDGVDHAVATGYFGERALQGGVDDGKIKCSDTIDSNGTLSGSVGHSSGNGSIFTRFVDTLGLPDKKYLFCDVNDQGQVVGPGIFKAKDGKVCGDTSPNTDYTRNGNPPSSWYESRNGETCITDEHKAWYKKLVSYNCYEDSFEDYAWYQHIKKLYNEAAEKYGWEHGFETVGYYYGTAGYYMYRNEMYTHCGLTRGSEERYDEKPSTFDNGMYLIDITQDTEQSAQIKYTYIPQDNEIDRSFVSRFDDNKSTCSDMISRANNEEIYGQYRERMKFVLNTLCERSMTERYNEADPSKIPDDTKNAYNAAKADTSNYSIGQFIEAVEKNSETTGWRCRDIGEFNGAGQEEPTLDDDIIGDNDEENCYSRAGSLGWIVCPLITTGAEMVQKTYEGMVVPFLRMDPKLFVQDSGTYVAWDIFRNIANIAFVIVFLVVILSQLTGYGIDNYGIKKILPKLVIAAIAINMSYIICQLAIDICNIVGAAIGDIFIGIGNTIMSSAPSYCTEGACNAATASSGGAGAFIAIVAVVVAITVAAVLAIGPQILIPVLLAIIGFVIAVFFLFVILGIRQAVAVLLVAASPLAFLCYMLPNIKKVFDKWLNTLKGLLIAYPVCSAMVYGGDMVAKIILSNYGRNTPTDLASITPILSAGVIAVAPIFLIPGVIKKSMGAIGSLSARLQGGLTHKARGSADRRLQNSPLTHRQRYNEKARMDRANARMGEYSRRRAARTIGKYTDENGKVDYSKMSAAQKRSFNVAQGTMAAYDAEMAKGYGYQMENANPIDAANLLSSSISRDGKVDMNAASAAINKLGQLDQGEMLEELEKFTSTSAFRNMSQTDRNKLISTLNAQSGNTVAKAYAKVLNDDPTVSLKDAMAGSRGGAIGEKIRSMDDQTAQNTDKDVLRYMSGGRHMGHDGEEYAADSAGLADAFSNSQIATAMTSESLSGKSKDNFTSVLEKRDEGLLNVDMKSIKSSEQFARADDSMLSKVEGKIGSEKMGEHYKKHMTELSAPGNEQAMLKVSDYKKAKFSKTK